MMRNPFLLILIISGLFFSSCNLNLNAPDDDNGNGEDPDTSATKFTNVTSSNLPSSGLSGTTQSTTSIDIDNDGDLDLAVALQLERNILLQNNGSGEFSRQMLSTLEWNSRDVITADFNNDDNQDLFFVNHNNQENELFINDGDGTFSDLSNRIPVTGNFTSAVAWDVNRDDATDILIGGLNQNRLLQNIGNARFTNETTQRLPQLSDATQDIAMGDINGDNRADIVVANLGNNRIFINNGTGFFDNQSNRYAFSNQAEESRNILLFDADDDGDLDIYVANSNFGGSANPQDRLLINDGNGFFSDQTSNRLPSLAADNFDAEAADLDNDSDLDLVIGNYNGGVSILLNDGNGNFTNETEDWIPEDFFPRAMDIEVADFNDDGLPDIYIAVREGSDKLLLQKENAN